MIDRQKRRLEAQRARMLAAKLREELASSFGGELDTAAVLRVFLRSRKLAKKESKISETQLAANQANAQLSTGPKSDEGKAIAAQTTAATQTEGDVTFLDGESKEACAQTLAGFQKEWKPATETEHDLVARLATRQWLRRRGLRLQNQFLAPDGTILDKKQFALYNCYETQHERAYDKALADVMRLKSLRLREQNGFEAQNRKDEIPAFKIKALKDREYRNELQILARDARLTLAQYELNKQTAPNIPETADQTTVSS